MAQRGPGNFTFDSSNNLQTTGGGSGGPTSDVNLTEINGAAPAFSNALPVELSDGNNVFGVSNNPIYAIISTPPALTPAAPTAVTVGITSTTAVLLNASRKGLLLTNTSSNTISLGFGSAAVLNSGVTLPPFGSFEMDARSFYAGAVTAIASASSSNLAIQEYS